MTGYLEVLTDPSYAGQAVVMTYPLIGNYGICREDMESRQAWPDGYIVRELSRIPSNFRSEDTIQHFLESNHIPGISGIDTRALTKILREKGTMNGMITTKVYEDLSEPISRMKQYTVKGVVKATSCKEAYVLNPTDPAAETISVRTAEKPESLKTREGEGKKVALAVIQVGNDPASSVYVRNKKKACEYIGIESLSYELPEETTQEELLALVEELNKKKEVNGILVQLPLPKHIDEDKVIKAIDPSKDVDGFHPENVGALSLSLIHI